MTTPGTTERTFSAGRYGVFERTGTSRGGGGITFTEQDLPNLRPSDVTVTGPTGESIPTRYMETNETINQNGALYTGVVEFHITEPGPYRVQIDRVQGQAIVTRDLLDGQAHNVVLGLVSGFSSWPRPALLTISSIVVAVRRRREQRATVDGDGGRHAVATGRLAADRHRPGRPRRHRVAPPAGDAGPPSPAAPAVAARRQLSIGAAGGGQATG